MDSSEKPTISSRRLDFSDEGDGFGAYHDLYRNGGTIARTGDRFRATVTAHLFPRMLLFDRRVIGASHHRTASRVRRDGYDHVNIQVLRSGSMAAGPPGDERAMRPGDVVVFDTARPQHTVLAEADFVSMSIARDAIARDAIGPAPQDAGGWHGVVLSGGAAGLLGDFMLSLARHAASLAPAVADMGADMAGQLLRAAIGGLEPDAATRGEASAGLDMLRWRAEAFIDAHLGHPALDADQIAVGIGASRTRLYAAFVPAGGVAREILRRRLTRLAEALLRPGEARTVAALAFEFGFAHEASCSRAFRAKFGCPPGQYRAEARRFQAPVGPASKTGSWGAWWDDNA